MKISVIGAGYVGLVTGTVFAELGNSIICIDKDKKKITNLNKGILPIYEPGLQEMFKRNVEEKKLIFTSDIAYGVQEADIIFIAVGTPAKENGETDLSQIEETATEIGKNINTYKIVVNKSTVPVGTGDLVREIIYRYKPADVECDVVSNPEFLAEGTAIYDAMSPERIVIGAPNKQVAMKLIELYSILEKPMVITSVKSAEMIKYASNAFLATKVSFINSIANLCEAVGADIEEVVRGMGLDSRIGSKFLRPGIGYGGSCFPKDTESLLDVSKKYNRTLEILQGTISINKKQPYLFVDKIAKNIQNIQGKTLGVLGMAFKPGTDDMRESSALTVIKALLDKGAILQVFDPMAMEKCKDIIPQVKYCTDEYETAAGASALILLTEWNRFKQLDFSKIKNLMKENYIFDGRNLYDCRVLKRYGFKYFGVGRGEI